MGGGHGGEGRKRRFPGTRWDLNVCAFMSRSADREAASGFRRRKSGFSSNEKNGERAIRFGHDRDGSDVSVRTGDLELRENRFAIFYRLFVGLQL